jgi:hypothetical protein
MIGALHEEGGGWWWWWWRWWWRNINCIQNKLGFNDHQCLSIKIFADGCPYKRHEFDVWNEL